jgi:hypothetical protein
MTAHELRALPDQFPVPDPEPDPEPQEQEPAPKVVNGSVSGKLVDPDDIRKLEPLARQLMRLGSPEVGKSSRAVVVAEDVQMTLAILRACTLHMNVDGSMPLMRIKSLWDKMFEAEDTTRAFNFHRFAAIRNMLTDLGLLEWEDGTYQFGKACKWRAGEELMGMIEEALSSNTTIPSPSSILLCNVVAEAQRNRPDQIGLRPKRVYPSLLRMDWDEKLSEAGLEHLCRQAV